MTFKVTVIGLSTIKNQVDNELKSEVKRLADSLFTEVRNRTPVDTGKARSGWKKKVTDKNFEISNNVNYIEVLDRGRHMTNRGMRGSKQAPKGIVGPSLESIKGKN